MERVKFPPHVRVTVTWDERDEPKAPVSFSASLDVQADGWRVAARTAFDMAIESVAEVVDECICITYGRNPKCTATSHGATPPVSTEGGAQ